MTSIDKTSGVSRRTWMKSVAAATSLSLAGCTGGGDGDGGETDTPTGTTTGSPQNEELHLGFSLPVPTAYVRVVEESLKWWASDRDDIRLSTTMGDGAPSTQIQQARSLIQSGVDGLVQFAIDSNALAQIPNEAEIPVFGTDIPTNSEQIGLHVGSGNERYGYLVGKELTKRLNEQKPGKSEYNVLELILPQANANGVLRHRGFLKAVRESEKTTIVKAIQKSGYTSSEATQKVSAYLQTNSEIDGILSPGSGSTVGSVTALEQRGMKAKVGEEGHVVISAVDASNGVLKLIQDGFVDVAHDQPNLFYGTIALAYLEEYIRSGEDRAVLPEFGSSLTRNDIDVRTGNTHKGVEVWKEPIWAPADVLTFTSFTGENLGYPFIRTANPTITKENADMPQLWGNLQPKIGVGGE